MLILVKIGMLNFTLNLSCRRIGAEIPESCAHNLRCIGWFKCQPATKVVGKLLCLFNFDEVYISAERVN